MWERLRRFRALDSGSQWLFVRAWVLLRLISAGLAIRGFRGTQSVLRKFLGGPLESHANAARPDPNAISRTVRMVRAAARYGIGSPACLEKSLALWWLLERQGIPAALRIGTRKSDAGLEAHAWVEQNGAILDEQDESDFPYSAFEGSFSAQPPTAG